LKEAVTTGPPYVFSIEDERCGHAKKWAAGSWRSIAMVTDAAYSVMREGSEWSGDALLPIVAMHVEGTSFGSGGLMRRMGLGPVENEGKVARQ
jgi:hypothetical protein